MFSALAMMQDMPLLVVCHQGRVIAFLMHLVTATMWCCPIRDSFRMIWFRDDGGLAEQWGLPSFQTSCFGQE